jgi:hypothetical protein
VFSVRSAALALIAICLAPAAARADDPSQDCRDQHNTPCDTGQQGVCAAGLWKCSGNGLRCERQQGPSPEVCGNGLDDDCDGMSDGQDMDCRCRDADNDGYAVCSNGCTPASGDQCGDCDDSRGDIHPGRSEVCNGRDDDCDDSVDEGNPGGGATCHTGEPGICDAGLLVCAAGGLHCASNLSPRPEDCDNGLDDDCNGQADAQDPSCGGDCDSAADADGDRVADCADNCPGLANARQEDFDGDGTGDACETGARLCDADLSGRVDGRDLALLAVVFGRTCSSSGFDERVDLTRDCRIDGDDLALLASFFGQAH